MRTVGWWRALGRYVTDVALGLLAIVVSFLLPLVLGRVVAVFV